MQKSQERTFDPRKALECLTGLDLSSDHTLMQELEEIFKQPSRSAR